MTGWEPATEAEVAMRDALRAQDQQQYFRLLTRIDLVLPVGGGSTAGWGTWTSGGRTHVLAFTSVAALRASLGENAGATRVVAYPDLAAGWPNQEWWLAVDPGLPIEGYLPAWYVAQLARGDVRLPGRTMGARARLDRVESAARAARNGVPETARQAPFPRVPAAPAPPPPVPPSRIGRVAEAEEPSTVPMRTVPVLGRRVPTVPPRRRTPEAGRTASGDEPGSDALDGWLTDLRRRPDEPDPFAAGRDASVDDPPAAPAPPPPARSFFEPSSGRSSRRPSPLDAPRRSAERATPPSRFAGGQPFPRRRPLNEPVREDPTRAFPIGADQPPPASRPDDPTQPFRPARPAEDTTATLPRRHAGPAAPAPDQWAGENPVADLAEAEELPPSVAEPVSAPPTPRRDFTPIVIEGTVIEARDLTEPTPAWSPPRADPVVPVPGGDAPAAWVGATDPTVPLPVDPVVDDTVDLAAHLDATGTGEPVDGTSPFDRPGVGDEPTTPLSPAAAPPVSLFEPSSGAAPSFASTAPFGSTASESTTAFETASAFEPTTAFESASAQPTTVFEPTTAFEPTTPYGAASAFGPEPTTAFESPGSGEPTVSLFEPPSSSADPTVSMFESTAPLSEPTNDAPAPLSEPTNGAPAPLSEPTNGTPASLFEPPTEPLFPPDPFPAEPDTTSPLGTPTPESTSVPAEPSVSWSARSDLEDGSPRSTVSERSVDEPTSAGATTPPAGRPEFVPANEVEEELLAAAGSGNTDGFLTTLLLARVLLPVAPDSVPGSRPGDPGFVWHTRSIDGGTYVVAYTSPERLAEHADGSVDTVRVKFVQLIRRWPDAAWSFLVNPGSPVGAAYPGEQVLALANWAAEVGLGDEPEPPVAAPAPAAEPRPAAPPTDPSLPVTMQKAIAASQLAYYLERGYDRVSGFVHRAGELAHLRTPAELYDALGLGHPGSPFSRDDDEVYLLRWPAHRPSLYRIPYGGQNEAAMRAMEGWVIERSPFRGNGFAPGESTDVVAEFKVDSARLPHGAELWRVGADADARLVAVLDTDALVWRKADEA
ncbi:SseB family protein [Micromonospora sediminicola]|uniref:SseB family protein n=1 Tax=Micromonospora sediminicola TaxID=946078 RepID=UPI0033A2AED8